MKLAIGLVEDNARLVDSITAVLGCFDHLDLKFVARNGEEALVKTEVYRPDVVLMDIEMPVMDGVTATRELRERYPEIKVIMLTVFDQEDRIFEAILAGANGYLLKDERPQKLVEALEEAVEGGAPMSPVIAAKALKLLRVNAPQPAPTASKADNPYALTRREWEILEWTAKGFNYHQVGTQLFISPKTVRKHIENIYRKLEVHSKVEAVALALKNRWFDL
ncbi:MAG: response regulator [Salibacteraceae bacterium]